MRLIDIHIGAFGALRDVRMTFSEGANCLCRNNGFGKSTLCAFIKAMLYGLPAARGSDAVANERRRALPFTGGCASGSLTFCTGRGVYRVERRFGARPSEDSFRLTDAFGVDSTDYTARLGEELFGVDAVGFESTVFFSERRLTASAAAAQLCRVFGTDSDASSSGNDGTDTRGVQDEMPHASRTASEATDGGLADAIARLDEARRICNRRTGGTLTEAEERVTRLKESASLPDPCAALARVEEEIRRTESARTSADNTPTPSRSEQERARLRVFFGAGVPQREELSHVREQYDRAAKLRAGMSHTRPHRTRRILAFFWIFFACALLCIAAYRWVSPLLSVIGAVFAVLSVGSILFWIVNKRKQNKVCSDTQEAIRLEKSVGEFLGRYPVATTDPIGEIERNLCAWEQLSGTCDSPLMHTRQNDECMHARAALYAERERLLSLGIERAEAQADLPQAIEQLNREQSRLRHIQKTREYLLLASQNMRTRYLGTLQTRVERLLAELTPDALPSLRVRPDLCTERAEAGVYRSLSLCSRGEQALYAFVLRVALVRTLFVRDMPPLVLDDPFSDLDAPTLARAKSLLVHLAKDGQLLYLTCSPERTL